jgi:hypothetical protein
MQLSPARIVKILSSRQTYIFYSPADPRGNDAITGFSGRFEVRLEFRSGWHEGCIGLSGSRNPQQEINP